MNMMPIVLFQDSGYLQEANRQFFHPLGLALAVVDGSTLSIIDCRNDDLDGIWFDFKNMDEMRIEKFRKNATFIELEKMKRADKRIELFRNIKEPIPE